jgi:hypothetical protein
MTPEDTSVAYPFQAIGEFAHRNISKAFCIAGALIILYPPLIFALWQLHFAFVLRNWHRKGSNAKLAVEVDRAAREIDWNEMADVASVSQQR